MYVTLTLRQHKSRQDVCNLLAEMALDSRLYPRNFCSDPDSRPLPHSTASAPALRSRNSVYLPMNRPSDGPRGGNVKVVVRVRTFLPRGVYSGACLCSWL